MLGPPTRMRSGTVWGTVTSPGISTQRSVTIQMTRVAPKMARTSPGSAATETSWSQRASIVPPVTTAPVSGLVPAGSPISTTTGIWSGRTPRAASGFGPPALGAAEVAVDDGGDRVHGRHSAQGVGGHGLAGPVAGGRRGRLRRPAEEPPGVGHARCGPGRLEPGPLVAVEDAGQERDPAAVDGGHRGHHRRHRHPGDGHRELRDHLGEGPTGTLAPGPARVVLELLGLGDHDPMGHPGPGHDVAVAVHRHRFDRRRADVDADGDGAAVPARRRAVART